MQNLSKTTIEKLEKIGRTTTAETTESIRQRFVDSKIPQFDPIIEAFLQFGGYSLPFRLEGRFNILRAKAALRMLRFCGEVSNDPLEMRIPFGESETIQAQYTMDGLGRIYEDEIRIAESLANWIEAWANSNHV
ncbi:MAG: hypothetical protein JNL58_09775 [Planctomyces sp.]|nr:hypothetical protein [Planctomyces sp.]